MNHLKQKMLREKLECCLSVITEELLLLFNLEEQIALDKYFYLKKVHNTLNSYCIIYIPKNKTVVNIKYLGNNKFEYKNLCGKI